MRFLLLILPFLFFGKALGDDAIPASLTGAKGDPQRGRAIVASRQVGLCLLCHSGPFPEERFQGNLAPDLRSAGRLTEGEIRLRVVDPARASCFMATWFSKGRTHGCHRHVRCCT